MRLTIFLFFISFSFFAQGNDFSKFSASKDINRAMAQGGVWVVNNADAKEIEGSVFLFSTWENLYVIESVQGNSFSINNLNYNIETTEIETKFSKDSLFQFNKADISFVNVNNRKYKLLNNELYQVLFLGKKCSLFKNFKISTRKGTINPLTQLATADVYVRKSEYFYMNNGGLMEIKLKKKDILNLMSDIQNEVKTFVSKNGLSYSKEEDIVKIFKNFNY